MVHNGGSQNSEGSLFNKKTTYVAQILRSLSYKVCFIILPNFNKFGLFILILGTSAIMDQTACCYNMTTSEIGLLMYQQICTAVAEVTIFFRRGVFFAGFCKLNTNYSNKVLKCPGKKFCRMSVKRYFLIYEGGSKTFSCPWLLIH